MVRDDEANATIAWLSRDSFVPILFRRLKRVYGKTTFEGVGCGIADILVATLATTSGNRELDGRAVGDAWLVGELDSRRRGTNFKAYHTCAYIPLRPRFSQEIQRFDDGHLMQPLFVWKTSGWMRKPF